MANLENCILLNGNGEQITTGIIHTAEETSGDGVNSNTLTSFNWGGETLSQGVFKFWIAPAVEGWTVNRSNFNISGVGRTSPYGGHIPPDTIFPDPDENTEELWDWVAASQGAFLFSNGQQEYFGDDGGYITMHEAVEAVWMHNTSPAYPWGDVFSYNQANADNRVEVTIKLKDEYVLPETNVIIDIDFDGDAYNPDGEVIETEYTDSTMPFKFHIMPYVYGTNIQAIEFTDDDMYGSVASGVSVSVRDDWFMVKPVVESGFQYVPSVTCCSMVSYGSITSGDVLSEPHYGWQTNDSTAAEYFFNLCQTYPQYVRTQYYGAGQYAYENNDQSSIMKWQNSTAAASGSTWSGQTGLYPTDFFTSGLTGSIIIDSVNSNPVNEMCRAAQFHNYNSSSNTTSSMWNNSIGGSNLPASCKFRFNISPANFYGTKTGCSIPAENCGLMFVVLHYTLADGTEVTAEVGEGNDCPIVIAATTWTNPGDEELENVNGHYNGPSVEMEIFFNNNFEFTGTSENPGALMQGSTMKLFPFVILDTDCSDPVGD